MIAAHAMAEGWTFEEVCANITSPRAKHALMRAFQLVPHLHRVTSPIRGVSLENCFQNERNGRGGHARTGAKQGGFPI